MRSMIGLMWNGRLSVRFRRPLKHTTCAPALAHCVGSMVGQTVIGPVNSAADKPSGFQDEIPSQRIADKPDAIESIHAVRCGCQRQKPSNWVCGSVVKSRDSVETPARSARRGQRLGARS